MKECDKCGDVATVEDKGTVLSVCDMEDKTYRFCEDCYKKIQREREIRTRVIQEMGNAITSTDLLNWLFEFVRVVAVDGEDSPSWKVVVDAKGMADAIMNSGFRESIDSDLVEICRGVISYPPKKGFEKRSILAGIDHAIREGG